MGLKLGQAFRKTLLEWIQRGVTGFLLGGGGGGTMRRLVFGAQKSLVGIWLNKTSLLLLLRIPSDACMFPPSASDKMFCLLV